MHRLIIAEGGNDLTIGINGYQLAEEVVKHCIINNDSSHNGWVQPERMQHNAQNMGPRLPGFTGALHGAVKRPALVVQRLSAAAVMLRSPSSSSLYSRTILRHRSRSSCMRAGAMHDGWNSPFHGTPKSSIKCWLLCFCVCFFDGTGRVQW